MLIHQQARVFLDQLAEIGFDDLTATDVWVALALFQTILDPQDPHVHAPFLWRERLALPGSSRRASVLLVEGIGDGFVPNHATESLAVALGGVAVAEPGRASLPGLERARGFRWPATSTPRPPARSCSGRPSASPAWSRHPGCSEPIGGADRVGGTLLCAERAGIQPTARGLLHVGAERRCARGVDPLGN